MLTEEFGVSYFYINSKNEDDLYLCQLFTYAVPISTLVEPKQMMLGFLVDQSHSG